jgi:hypothetical protein
VLEPAVYEVGLEVSYPRLGPISRTGMKTTAFLIAIADAAELSCRSNPSSCECFVEDGFASAEFSH